MRPVCNIPVDSPRVPDGSNRPSPAWLRPVHKRHTPSPTTTRDNSASPAYTGDQTQSQSQGNIPNYNGSTRPSHKSGLSLGDMGENTDLDVLFNTDKYFNAMSPLTETFDLGGMNQGQNQSTDMDYLNGTLGSTSTGGFGGMATDGGNGYNDFSINIQGNGLASEPGAGGGEDGLYNGGGNTSASGAAGLNFDFGGSNGFGGEMLAGEGMDSVSDGLKGGENQGL